MLRRYLFAGIIIVASLVQGWAAAAQQLTADATYVWVNELGSKMTTSWGADGLITGTYVSAVGMRRGHGQTADRLVAQLRHDIHRELAGMQLTHVVDRKLQRGNDYDAVAINGVRPPGVKFDQRRNRHLHASVAVRVSSGSGQ